MNVTSVLRLFARARVYKLGVGDHIAEPVSVFFKLLAAASCPDYDLAKPGELLCYGRHPVEIFFRYEKHFCIRAVDYVFKKIHLVGRIYRNHNRPRFQDSEPGYDVVIGVRHVHGHLFRFRYPERTEGVCHAVC